MGAAEDENMRGARAVAEAFGGKKSSGPEASRGLKQKCRFGGF